MEKPQYEAIRVGRLHGPVVNLNGADRRDLIREHLAVKEAAGALLEALRSCGPHGRDYQTAGDGLYAHDRAMWEAHIKAAEKIHRDYERVAIDLTLGEP